MCCEHVLVAIIQVLVCLCKLTKKNEALFVPVVLFLLKSKKKKKFRAKINLPQLIAQKIASHVEIDFQFFR